MLTVNCAVCHKSRNSPGSYTSVLSINTDREYSERSHFIFYGQPMDMKESNPIFENSLELELNGEDLMYVEDLNDDFKVFKIEITEKKKTIDAVKYIRKLHNSGGLDIKKKQSEEFSYKRRVEAGLFLSFLNKTLFN